jgi:hypothetical protein
MKKVETNSWMHLIMRLPYLYIMAILKVIIILPVWIIIWCNNIQKDIS